MQKAAQASAARAARRNAALSDSSLPLGDMLAAGSRRRLSALSADFSVRPELTSLPDATDRISALSASVANYKAQVERAQSALCDEAHLQRLYGERLQVLRQDNSLDSDSMPSA